jgi:hypothetical protein
MSAKGVEVNIPLVATISIVSVLALTVILIGTHAFYLMESERDIRVKWENAVYEPVATIKEQQKASLNRLEWADQDAGTVRLPIEDAMRIMVQTQGKLPTTQPSP